MPEEAPVVASETQPSDPGVAAQMLDVKPQMMVLTWLSFGIVAIALAKALWRPVLQALEKREEGIRNALDAAEKAREEVSTSRNRAREIQESADRTAKERIESATRQSEELLENARREAAEAAEKKILEAENQIAVERESVVAAVQAESLRSFGSVLERVLAQNLTDEQKRTYQDAMLREMKL